MTRVMAVFNWPGDTEILRDNYDRILEHVVAVSSARPIIHLATGTETGFRVIDVWDNETICRQMLDNPDFQAKLVEFGLGDVTITVSDVHNLGWPVSAVPMYR